MSQYHHHYEDDTATSDTMASADTADTRWYRNPSMAPPPLHDDDTTTTFTEDDVSTTQTAPRLSVSKLTAQEAKTVTNNKMISEEITGDLKEFIDLCEQIRTAKEEIRLFTERKAELEGKIFDYMRNNGIPAFITPNGRITLYNAKSVKPLNKEYFKETVSSKIPDEKMVEELMQLVFSKRPTTQVQKIKVTPARKP